MAVCQCFGRCIACAALFPVSVSCHYEWNGCLDRNSIAVYGLYAFYIIKNCHTGQSGSIFHFADDYPSDLWVKAGRPGIGRG